MKKLYILFLCFALLGLNHLSAQQVTITPSDSISSDVGVNNNFATFDEYIYLVNMHSDSIQINWRLLSDTVPNSAWSLQLCDNKNCYPLPNTPKTSLMFGPGDSLNMHALIAPNLTAGSGWMKISAQIVGDTFPAVILTYHANVTVTSGINNITGEPNTINVFPNPASDVITVDGLIPSNAVTIQILDLQGRIVSTESRIENTSFTKNISQLPAGCYFIKVLDTENKLTAVKKFSKL